MYHAEEGFLSATNELLLIHVNQQTRCNAPMAPEILERLEQIQAVHEKLPVPSYIGRVFGLKAEGFKKTGT